MIDSLTFNNIYIMPHCGFGDAIVTVGLINYYAEIYGIVYVFGSVHNKVNLFLKYIFKDNQKIKIIEFYEPKEKTPVYYELLKKRFPIIQTNKFLGLGIWQYLNNSNINIKNYDDKTKRIAWNISFYEQVGLSFDLSWLKFNIYRNHKTEEELCNKLLLKCDKNNIVFIHDDIYRNLTINSKYKIKKHVVPKLQYTEHITNYITFLEMCDEIHCIDSSFLHIVDRVNTKPTTKLFLHWYVRPVRPPALKKDWTIIKNP